MAKSANQKIKILYLMRILLERTDEEHGLSINDMIAALAEYGVDVERKTLYDDIETLRLFGLDIEPRKSKTVQYHVVSRQFELPELKLLVDAVQASKFITRKKSNELIKKIESFASVYEAGQLQRQVYVDGRIKTMNESIYYAVDTIHEAIGKNVKVAFQYFEWNEKKQKQLRHGGKQYLISPWALTWDDENYYMIGFDTDNDAIRHYRVDKMTNLTLTEESRDGADLFDGFDMAVYSKRTFGMYGGKEEAVTLRCKKTLAGVIIDRFGQDVPFYDVTDTHFCVRVTVHTSPLFYSWILGFGDDITVLSPGRVRQELVDLAARAIAQYR